MRPTTIGNIARRVGVGVETIRFYERKGLIERPPRPTSGGFRTYPQETVRRVRFIRQAQGLGFSLAEIQALLSLRAAPGAMCGDMRAFASAKLEDIDLKLQRLGRMRAALAAMIDECPGQGTIRRCSIIEALENERDPACPP